MLCFATVDRWQVYVCFCLFSAVSVGVVVHTVLVQVRNGFAMGSTRFPGCASMCCNGSQANLGSVPDVTPHMDRPFYCPAYTPPHCLAGR